MYRVLHAVGQVVPPLPELKGRRRSRIPSVLDVPRMVAHPPARLTFDYLEAFDLPGGAVRGFSFLVFLANLCMC